MKIEHNMGEVDRLVRTVAGIGLLGLALTGVLHGAVAGFVAVVAVVLLVTSAFSFCPLYTLFGLNTRRTQRMG